MIYLKDFKQKSHYDKHNLTKNKSPLKTSLDVSEEQLNEQTCFNLNYLAF